MKLKNSKIYQIFRIIAESNQSLVNNKLGSLIPFFIGLLLFAIFMIFIKAISPLAPFVYSLF